MKWLEISEETFLQNRKRANIVQNDGRCFGLDICTKFYLYVDNGDKYILNIYEKSLQDILWDSWFHTSILSLYLDKRDFVKIEEISHWINATLDVKNFPFALEDIHYCDYDG